MDYPPERGGGGHPVWMENLRGLSELYRGNGIPLFVDACQQGAN